MGTIMPFAELVDAVDKLSLEEQKTLVELVRHRVAEQGRKALAEEIETARAEFAQGGCRPATADDLMDEILS